MTATEKTLSTLQARFAREEGLSPPALIGEVFDPRFSWRVDGYDLIARPDAEFGPGRLRDTIDAIEISAPTRFSNSLIQLSNVLALASILSGDVQRSVTIRTPELWYLPSGATDLCDVITLDNGKKGPDDSVLTLRGRFFYLSTLGPMFEPKPDKYAELQRIAPYITIPASSDLLSEDDLVIHIRSGDVFKRDGENPHYGQPPLAYYRRIVSSRLWRSVHLVFEDKENVVIDPLIGFISALNIPLRVHSGSLESDLSLLMAAKTLVAGIGTFIPGVTTISRNIRTVYAFDRYQNWGNKGLNVIRCEDVPRGYISAVLSANWKNLPEQRQLMLSYLDENILIPGH